MEHKETKKEKQKNTRSMKVRKEKFLEAYRQTLGNIASSCRASGIGRTTFYRWLKEDADFKQEVSDIEEESIDFVESELKKSIKNGNVTAQIFFLKTKAKDRGYTERVEFKVDEGAGIDIEVIVGDTQNTQSDT